MKDLKYWVAASMIPNIGAVAFKNLYEYFGTMENFWLSSDTQIIELPVLNKNQKKDILKYRKTINPQKELDRIKDLGINVITLASSEYPPGLKNIYDAPGVIYTKGKFELEDIMAVAIVGTRKATAYGKNVAYELAAELVSYGFTIISGMALGIDTWAHKGALKGNGRTVAVLGSGVDQPYPKSNKKLYAMIKEHGAVVSEYPPGTRPHPKNFPARNRIISALSMGVIVVEAPQRSGALITADFALEQGREVFAVPGNITSIYSRGSNNLIKQGAKLVETAEDVVSELEYTYKINKRCKTPETNERNQHINSLEQKVLNIISYQATLGDYIISKSGLPAHKVNSILTQLELKGKIRQLPGRSFIRV